MTPKGHVALAQAIVEAMHRPPGPTAELALPEGRSWVPTSDEFRREKEFPVERAAGTRCTVRLVREWLRVQCLGGAADDIVNIVVLKGGHGDARTWRYDGSNLILPVLEGDSTQARFIWGKATREFSVEFPKGGALTMAFSAPKPHQDNRGEERLVYDGETDFDAPSVPTCEAGLHVAGAMRRCARSCDAKTPCAKGHCEPWPSGDFCAVP